jgi:hypothetical protein
MNRSSQIPTDIVRTTHQLHPFVNKPSRQQVDAVITCFSVNKLKATVKGTVVVSEVQLKKLHTKS